VERTSVRESGYWICGVSEEGDVLCGKAVAAMWVFPHIDFNLSFKMSHSIVK
jgi:hypothetical protein